MTMRFGRMAKRCSFVKNQSPSLFTIWKNERRVSVRRSLILQKPSPRDPVTDRIISQLVGAGTSVGANYVEADDSVSKKEFLKCIGICKKEARETKHFLRMVVRAVPELRTDARQLWMEARELHLIFAKIWRSGKQRE
jgi:four helix bundle protein